VIEDGGVGVMELEREVEDYSVEGSRQIQGDVGACGNLNTANTVYTLTANVNNDATCFTVQADNVTLDCQGYRINYSSAYNAYGVNNVGYNNTRIENCVFGQGNESVLYSAAVFCSKVVNCTVAIFKPL